MPVIEPCAWPVTYLGCDVPAAWEELDAAVRAVWERMAATLPWRWTGQAFTSCEVTARPLPHCCDGAGSTYWGSGPNTRGYFGRARVPTARSSCSRHAMDPCACGGASIVMLEGPVDSVVEVLIDGVTLAPDGYRLVANRLYRRGGFRWPECQDLAEPDTAEHTWSIRYVRGFPVPDMGKLAAGLLAIELWKASCGDKGCKLPARLQSVTRQGVSMAVLDSSDYLVKGGTGINTVDMWVASINNTPRGGYVFSPDLRYSVP